jgi:hypothetical protein
MLTSISSPDNSYTKIYVSSNIFGQMILHSENNILIQSSSLSDLTGKLINKWGPMSLGRESDVMLETNHEVAQGIYLLNLKTSERDFTFKILR